ncbi:serine/arginine-rich splicing factor RS31 isoform X1 [Senna tora]|uniref:Serine/arginine-rich splicing factor RS31 isoform X1 n=1 Tax=Senna tora TaxID=362788 RepID=A0A834XG71_9FABA|nr:serine/arginine-rich splicing factor RS31 isoform X1 [Senna tora]
MICKDDLISKFWVETFNCNDDFASHSINHPTGFAFIYCEDQRDAEYAIHALDNFPYGYDKQGKSVMSSFLKMSSSSTEEKCENRSEPSPASIVHLAKDEIEGRRRRSISPLS